MDGTETMVIPYQGETKSIKSQVKVTVFEEDLKKRKKKKKKEVKRKRETKTRKAECLAAGEAYKVTFLPTLCLKREALVALDSKKMAP